MLDDVGQGLLHDAVGSQIEATADRRRVTQHVKLHFYAGGARVPDQVVEVREPGLWGTAVVPGIVGSHDTEHPLELDQRLPACGFDMREGFLRATSVSLQDA